jgi:predicted Rossmann-fold nucleotide-binding protein
MIAVDGSYGTISEAAIALKLGKPVVGLETDWHLRGMQKASSPKEAADFIFEIIPKNFL